MTGSKFSGLRAMREQREKAQQSEPLREGNNAVAPPELEVMSPLNERRKVGRPPGKRSNPEFQSVTILLTSKTYLAVRRELLGQKKDVSELVDELLKDWLKDKTD